MHSVAHASHHSPNARISTARVFGNLPPSTQRQTATLAVPSRRPRRVPLQFRHFGFDEPVNDGSPAVCEIPPP